MPHGKSTAEFGWKRKQIHFDSKSTVIPLFGFCQTSDVFFERSLRLPCCAVDALQHRTLLIAPPICACNFHQSKVSEFAGCWHVRTPTQVNKRIGIAIDAHNVATLHFRCISAIGGTASDACNNFAFVWLISKQFESSLGRHLIASKRLICFDDFAHLFSDCSKIGVTESFATRQFEVVVEAIFNCRTNRKFGTNK